METIGHKIWTMSNQIQRAYGHRGYKNLMEGMELAKTTLDVIVGIGAAALVIPTIIGSGPGSMLHVLGTGISLKKSNDSFVGGC